MPTFRPAVALAAALIAAPNAASAYAASPLPMSTLARPAVPVVNDSCGALVPTVSSTGRLRLYDVEDRRSTLVDTFGYLGYQPKELAFLGQSGDVSGSRDLFLALTPRGHLMYVTGESVEQTTSPLVQRRIPGDYSRLRHLSGYLDETESGKVLATTVGGSLRELTFRGGRLAQTRILAASGYAGVTNLVLGELLTDDAGRETAYYYAAKSNRQLWLLRTAPSGAFSARLAKTLPTTSFSAVAGRDCAAGVGGFYGLRGDRVSIWQHRNAADFKGRDINLVRTYRASFIGRAY